MTPYYADDWLSIYGGDCRAVLSELADESVHCVVTSPPYWGLRDYGTATWAGGDPDCAHTIRRDDGDHKAVFDGRVNRGDRSTCLRCDAVRADDQIGLEATPDAYVANMVAVFREVWRVLRNDGTLWLNLGDSYASTSSYNTTNTLHTEHGWKQDSGRRPNAYNVSGLKAKDLVGIPWRVAFALQADGWYLRSDIIWSKPNPMPESVTDRPTKSHEYLFLLAKSERYYFDADAVAEPMSDSSIRRLSQPTIEQQEESWRVPGKTNGAMKAVGGPSWQERKAAGATAGNGGGGATRNIRSVWTVATQPYPGAHFATFPPKLIEPCIKAGCPENGVVLDPFAGSGTTGMVAQSLSRRAVLIDLNPAYLLQALERNAAIPLGLSA